MNYRQVINFAGVCICLLSFFYEVLTPIWGVVVLYWVMAGLKTSEAFLFFRVHKSENSVMYWLIQMMWLITGIYSLLWLIPL